MFLVRWYKKKRRQKNCFHHDYSSEWKSTITWIKSELIDAGKNKRFWCIKCDQSWRAW